MRLGLIAPRATFFSRLPAFQSFYDQAKRFSTYRANWSGLSTGLLVVAALTPRRWQVEVVDENLDEVDFDAGYDLVGITLMTQQATRAYEIADAFRARGVPVVLGGLHATVLPEEAKAHADSVVVGEAEPSWPRCIADFEAGRLQPFYRASGLVDLADSPMPRYELIAGKPYSRIPYSRVWVQTTRGCPHDCEFCACSTVFGHRYRHKGIEQIVAEIERVKELCGNVSIGFADDNMLVNRKLSAALVERLIPLGLQWVAQTDISVARDEGLLELLRRSGCIHLFIGLESISEEGLRGLDARNWKLGQLAEYTASIERIQSHGIGVMGAFILGLDSDDGSVFERTTDFIVGNHLYDAQVSILTPFPGTRLRERLAGAGRLLDTPWSHYTVFDVNFVHPRLSKEELEEGLLGVYQAINTEEVHRRRLEHFRTIFKRIARAERRAARGGGEEVGSGSALPEPSLPA